MSTMVTERLVSISAYFDYALLYERLRQRLRSGQAQYKSLDGAGVEPCRTPLGKQATRSVCLRHAART
ncbi:MAG: hypothetical protein V7K77_25420 [Nostoc sp.]|uniref:hypothetical protein n=1 Tax=Nostoc sp. TaxID=1180 RepID=UPI002FF4A9C8